MIDPWSDYFIFLRLHQSCSHYRHSLCWSLCRSFNSGLFPGWGENFWTIFVICLTLMFAGQDGWYLIDLKQAQDAKHYFGKIPSILHSLLPQYLSMHWVHLGLIIIHIPNPSCRLTFDPPCSDMLKTTSPVHRIHIECFHTETKSVINTFTGNILTR